MLNESEASPHPIRNSLFWELETLRLRLRVTTCGFHNLAMLSHCHFGIIRYDYLRTLLHGSRQVNLTGDDVKEAEMNSGRNEVYPEAEYSNSQTLAEYHMERAMEN